jgi:hypothetical protein
MDARIGSGSQHGLSTSINLITSTLEFIKRRLDSDNDRETYGMLFQRVASGTSNTIWIDALRKFVERHPHITEEHNFLVRHIGNNTQLPLIEKSIPQVEELIPKVEKPIPQVEKPITQVEKQITTVRQNSRPYFFHSLGITSFAKTSLAKSGISAFSESVSEPHGGHDSQVPIAHKLPVTPSLNGQPGQDNPVHISSNGPHQTTQATSPEQINDTVMVQSGEFTDIYGDYGQFFTTTDKKVDESEPEDSYHSTSAGVISDEDRLRKIHAMANPPHPFLGDLPLSFMDYPN